MTDLVASTREEYVGIVVRMAINRAAAEVRGRIVRNSPKLFRRQEAWIGVYKTMAAGGVYAVRG